MVRSRGKQGVGEEKGTRWAGTEGGGGREQHGMAHQPPLPLPSSSPARPGGRETQSPPPSPPPRLQ